MKLGCRCNYHEGWVALRIYANQPIVSLNVKALGAFNQEKALEGAFSLIVKTDGSFAALVSSLRLSGSRLH